MGEKRSFNSDENYTRVGRETEKKRREWQHCIQIVENAETKRFVGREKGARKCWLYNSNQFLKRQFSSFIRFFFIPTLYNFFFISVAPNL